MEKYDAIVLAAGVGRRMAATKNKVLNTENYPPKKSLLKVIKEDIYKWKDIPGS